MTIPTTNSVRNVPAAIGLELAELEFPEGFQAEHQQDQPGGVG